MKAAVTKTGRAGVLRLDCRGLLSTSSDWRQSLGAGDVHVRSPES